jgi:hypothetical protein
MIYQVDKRKMAKSYGPTIAMRCPHCGHEGTFHNLIEDVILQNHNVYLGQRFCPNPNCHKHIFIISNSSGKVIKTYPGDTIPFDKVGIPDKIIETIEEANVCYSNNCYIAAGIMIRKTLEVLCDVQEASGKNLSERLKKLGKTILIPQELIEGMDELRLLGNDAAHVEAKTYENIGKEEIEISMEFTKEILKAVYQYDDLLTKLRDLKKPKE